MIIELNTNFTQEEKDILSEYREVDIKLFIDTNLFNNDKNMPKNPNRMIGVGGLYLLEGKDTLGSWYMGDWNKGSYSFWGNYGNLEIALKSL